VFAAALHGLPAQVPPPALAGLLATALTRPAPTPAHVELNSAAVALSRRVDPQVLRRAVQGLRRADPATSRVVQEALAAHRDGGLRVVECLDVDVVADLVGQGTLVAGYDREGLMAALTGSPLSPVMLTSALADPHASTGQAAAAVRATIENTNPEFVRAVHDFLLAPGTVDHGRDLCSRIDDTWRSLGGDRESAARLVRALRSHPSRGFRGDWPPPRGARGRGPAATL